MDYLIHYGVKGMKWGVRKDRTNKSNAVNINKLDYTQRTDLIRSGRDFVVKKGSEAYRATTTEYETEKGKKYVSLIEDDFWQYTGMVRDYSEPGENVYGVTYSAKKNINVAGARVQAELLQKIYGKNYRTDGRVEKFINTGRANKTALEKPISEMTDKEFYSYWKTNPFGHDTDILNKPITNKSTALYINELSKKGYDAVVDLMDASGYTEAPVIVFDSSKTLKRKSHRLEN